MLSFRLVLFHHLVRISKLRQNQFAHLFGIYTKLIVPGQNSEESITQRTYMLDIRFQKVFGRKTAMPVWLTIHKFFKPQLSVGVSV